MGSIGDSLTLATSDYSARLSASYTAAYDAEQARLAAERLAADAERSRIISEAMAATSAANLVAIAPPTAPLQDYSPPLNEQIFAVFNDKPWLMWVLLGLLILLLVWVL